MIKTQRIGIYGLCKYSGKIVAIRKKRGPFVGKLDLPGGKLEFGELHLDGLKRELYEELGILENSFTIGNVIGVFEDFSKHQWEGKNYDEHIIAIVYEVDIHSIDINFIEQGGDSENIYLIEKSDSILEKTNIFSEVLNYIKNKKVRNK